MILLKPIMSEILESIILEALPISQAKEYASIQRSSKVKNLQSSIFNKLESSPGYLNANRNGDRLYFKLEDKGDSKQSVKVPSEIEDTLKSKGFSIKDYKSGIAIDKYDREVKIGKVLQKISPELLKQFTLDSSRESSSSKQKLVVISRAPYDLGGMSNDRGWTSCMATGKVNARFVSCDIKEGTLIAYLISSDDLNIKSPQARMLIKPFINLKDSKDIIYYPEATVYGTAPDSFSELLYDIFDAFTPLDIERVRYNPKLYQDQSPNVEEEEYDLYDTISIKDMQDNKKSDQDLEKIVNGEPLTPKEKQRFSLDLAGRNIKSLPPGLKISNTAYLMDNPNLTQLPDDFEIEGWLMLQHTGITSLPQSLKMTKNQKLSLGNTPLSRKYTIEELGEIYPNILARISYATYK